jgi:hypothetical protein
MLTAPVDVHAGDLAQQECDALAANPYDSSRPDGVPGVQYQAIDAARAEDACRRAINEQPSPRLQFQLGRALQAGHKDADAVAKYRVAADQGNAPAQSALGCMYQG